jgi:SH3-like domain-containing protein
VRYSEVKTVKSCSLVVRALLLVVLAAILFGSGCKRGPLHSNEIAYVSAPQVNLRDRVAAIYNKVGTAKNGEKLEILEHQKRFVRVRTQGGQEGWVEERYLIGPDIYDAFQKLATDNKTTSVQSHGTTRAELNMHVSPGRDTEKLYQLADGEKIEILKRGTAERAGKQVPGQTKAAPKPAEKAGSKSAPKQVKDSKAEPVQTSPKSEPDVPKAYDDYWLVRNSAGHVGWVLARMIDLDVPLEIAQYAEGQRIMGAFIINKVSDEDKQVPQYLVLFSENKDGMPFDYNQARVFTWNPKKHRYETAYRERGMMGFFPVMIGTENFDKEGVLPTFTLRAQDQDGKIVERKYKLNQPIVRRVIAAGEQPQKLAAPPKPEKAKKSAKKRR